MSYLPETFTMHDKMLLISGKGMWHTNDCDGKLPSIHLADGPHGIRSQDENVTQNNDSKIATCFPTLSAAGSSWSTDDVALLASSVADEAIARDVSVVLGPGVNIKRSPLCGRNFEYFSEDPFLAGTLAASYINAVQAKGVGTSIKHFAGNSQETHRQTSDSRIDMRALREIYLTAFEIAVKNAQPATIMGSYNRLNGIYACENHTLLTDILRSEWGFKGLVLSDWSACTMLPKSLKAGMDLEMPGTGNIHLQQLEAAYAAGEITEAEITVAAERVAQLVKTYPPRKPADDRAVKDILQKHKEIAHTLACHTGVLLKNEGFLPLKQNASICIIGALAENMRSQGGGSSHINAPNTENALEVLTSYGMHITYEKGYEINNESVSAVLEHRALDVAKKAIAAGDKILFFGGLTEYIEGEGFDRPSLSLPKNQLHLFEQLSEITTDIGFVSFGGSAFEVPFIDNARAMLHMYPAGECTGAACADLITGRVNPSGRLAETFPLTTDDIPCAPYFGKDSDIVEYRESIFVGYRYYDTFKIPVLFPFGHGLSYTTFTYSNLTLSTDSFAGGELTVSVDITNNGAKDGVEVVQIYVQNPHATYLRAEKELRGFAKVFLRAGETRSVSVTLNDRSFSLYDTASDQFLLVPGQYIIHAAASIADIRVSQQITVTGTAYQRDDTQTLPSYFVRDGKHLDVSSKEFLSLCGTEHNTIELPGIDGTKFAMTNSLRQLARHSLLGKIVKTFAVHTVHKMFKDQPRDNPQVKMMVAIAVDGTLDCVICQSRGIVPYALGEAVVLDANGHHLQALALLLKLSIRRNSHHTA